MTHAHTTFPIYLRADTINGVQYCDHDEVISEHEYSVWFFTDYLADMKDGEVMFTRINTQTVLDDINALYGIN